MDVTAVSEAVAALVAAGGVKELADAAGGGLAVGIVGRLRKLFGSDARSMDALEQAQRERTPAAVTELASALAWYARRDQQFAEELNSWAAQARTDGVSQRVIAGRDAYTAAGNQTIINYRRPDE
jgi:hypothetical protein